MKIKLVSLRWWIINQSIYWNLENRQTQKNHHQQCIQQVIEFLFFLLKHAICTWKQWEQSDTSVRQMQNCGCWWSQWWSTPILSGKPPKAKATFRHNRLLHTFIFVQLMISIRLWNISLVFIRYQHLSQLCTSLKTEWDKYKICIVTRTCSAVEDW